MRHANVLLALRFGQAIAILMLLKTDCESRLTSCDCKLQASKHRKSARAEATESRIAISISPFPGQDAKSKPECTQLWNI
jgi:hypothetical protein